LNYVAPNVRFHIVDIVHLDVEALGSISEIGFSAGVGGAILIGDPYGGKLTLGFESIGFDAKTAFGNRFYSRLDVVAAAGWIVSPIVEVTNMPSAEDYGLRLLGELVVDLGGGFGAAARAGYQARVATSGGPTLGLQVSYAF